MARFHDRYAQAISWETKTTPCVRKLVDRSIEKARNMGIIPASSYEYNQTEFVLNWINNNALMVNDNSHRHMLPYAHHKIIDRRFMPFVLNRDDLCHLCHLC
jgi:hypothetical protein